MQRFPKCQKELSSECTLFLILLLGPSAQILLHLDWDLAPDVRCLMLTTLSLTSASQPPSVLESSLSIDIVIWYLRSSEILKKAKGELLPFKIIYIQIWTSSFVTWKRCWRNIIMTSQLSMTTRCLLFIKFCKDQDTSFANNLCSLKTHQTHHQHWSDSVWKLSNQVEVDFVRSIISAHFNQLKTKVSQ